VEYRGDITAETTDDVYPPSEDSILLIESIDVSEGERVLEIGCGSGIVSMHCAACGASVTAVDINPSAVECTRKNAERNGLLLSASVSDLYENVSGRFDTVIFNLPYLPVDEEGMLAKAWSGGEGGIGPLPGLLDGLRDHLSEDGRLVIVVSTLMDEEKLNGLLSGFSVRTVGELPLFFERLKVLEITPRTS
jgi:release factor glutamine methyltransferase